MNFSSGFFLIVFLLFGQQAQCMFSRTISRSSSPKSPRCPNSHRRPEIQIRSHQSRLEQVAVGTTAGYAISKMLKNFSEGEKSPADKFTCEQYCFLMKGNILANCFYANDNKELEPTELMLERADLFLRGSEDDNMLEWCKTLVYFGMNPSKYFPYEQDNQITEFLEILLVRACCANMPKVVKYLIDMHRREEMDCLIDAKISDDPPHTVGQKTYDVATAIGSTECADVLKKYLDKKLEPKAKL